MTRLDTVTSYLTKIRHLREELAEFGETMRDGKANPEWFF